ncbi:MAG: GNAT family N-acetyltransferase [Actinomycetota bacterium]|nr:GNAT family N-acetyltransferase [Actinomycetota bacterium]
MKLRGYREEDRGAVARVTATALGGSVEYWEEEYYEPEKNPRLDPDQVYVVEEDGEIRATAAVLPLEVFYEGRTVPMGEWLRWRHTQPTGGGVMQENLYRPR